MATILLIDDGDKMRMVSKIDLESAGYRFVSAASGRHGLRILEHQDADLILVNIFMPDMDSVELIQALRTTRPATKIIAITARKGLRNFIDMAKHLGADDTLEKPRPSVELFGEVPAISPVYWDRFVAAYRRMVSWPSPRGLCIRPAWKENPSSPVCRWRAQP